MHILDCKFRRTPSPERCWTRIALLSRGDAKEEDSPPGAHPQPDALPPRAQPLLFHVPVNMIGNRVMKRTMNGRVRVLTQMQIEQPRYGMTTTGSNSPDRHNANKLSLAVNVQNGIATIK